MSRLRRAVLAGGLRAWGAGPGRWRPDRLVLCFHNFGPPGDHERGYLDPRRRLPIQTFRRQLEWLDRVADIVPLGRIVDPGRNRLRVAITVDDGYLNNVIHMFPVLESMGVPATWFVATDFVDDPDRLPWWDLLDFLVERKEGTIELRDEALDVRLDLARDQDRRVLHRDVRAAMKSASPDRLRSMLGMLLDRLSGVRLPPNAFARADEVRSAFRSGCIEPGGHTAGHPNLARCGIDELRHEIVSGRRRLEEICGIRPSWFAFPFGGPGAVSPEAADVVRESGFDGAVTTITGVVDPKSDPFMIPRLTVTPGMSLGDFKGIVRGARLFSALRNRTSRRP